MRKGARRSRAIFAQGGRHSKLIFLTFRKPRIEYCHSPASSFGSCQASSGEILAGRRRMKPFGSRFEKAVFGLGFRAEAGAREGTYAPTTVVLGSLESRGRRCMGAKSARAGSNGADSDTARTRSTAGKARLGVGDAATGCRGAGADRDERALACAVKTGDCGSASSSRASASARIAGDAGYGSSDGDALSIAADSRLR